MLVLCRPLILSPVSLSNTHLRYRRHAAEMAAALMILARVLKSLVHLSLIAQWWRWLWQFQGVASISSPAQRTFCSRIRVMVRRDTWDIEATFDGGQFKSRYERRVRKAS